ncbi:MAG: hypothetical protein JWO94_3442 [Verrucomicrobiaceae bacterium]|nr:hypothetical protein [Verrucomicrobiaceae bacterium]
MDITDGYTLGTSLMWFAKTAVPAMPSISKVRSHKKRRGAAPTPLK